MAQSLKAEANSQLYSKQNFMYKQNFIYNFIVYKFYLNMVVKKTYISVRLCMAPWQNACAYKFLFEFLLLLLCVW